MKSTILSQNGQLRGIPSDLVNNAILGQSEDEQHMIQAVRAIQQGRLDFLQNLLDELIELGDRCAPNENEWAILRSHMVYATEYDVIGEDVLVIDGSSINLPFLPVLLDREAFHGDNFTAITVLVHEPMHDLLREGLGHEVDYFDGVNINEVVGPYTMDNYFTRLIDT